MLIGMPVLLLVVFGYAANFTVDNVPLQPSDRRPNRWPNRSR